jgi:putative ABC transport system permease protein
LTASPREGGRGARLFRALLALYPAAFRDEYGREMALLFADRRRDTKGPVDRGRLWLEVLAGVLAHAPREHLRLALEDARHAVRRLRLDRSLALTSVVTLGLAIGASTTLFAVLDAVLLRPLPFRSPDRLVLLWTSPTGEAAPESRSAYGTVEQWRTGSRAFEDLAVFDPSSMALTVGAELRPVSVLRVSPNLFPLLGITPGRGRAFTPEEAEAGQGVAVISDRFWRARFGGADALGATLLLDGRPSVIVGILPASVSLPGLDADVWEAHTLAPGWNERRAATGAGSWYVVGRLRPQVALAEARAEMGARGARVTPLARQVAGDRLRLVLWTLMGAGACILLVAAANVAGLAAARHVSRLPELAVRVALGASRARLVRLLLAESLTLAVLAAVLGLLVAIAGTAALRAFGPPDVSRLAAVVVDVRAIAWAGGLALLAGLGIGVAPTAAFGRSEPWPDLADAGRAVGSARTARLRRSLVVAECAGSTVLLAVGALLLRSYANVLAVDPGFRPERVLSMNVAAPAAMPVAGRVAFYERLLEQAAAVPGVERAGLAGELFIGAVSEQDLTAEGRGPQPLPLRRDEVSPGFFQAVGTPLRRGRFFSADDTARAPRVAIVNEALARRVWPGQDPIGRLFTLGVPGPPDGWLHVVGVVGDMRRQGLDSEPVPQVFEPVAQNPSRRAILFVRTSADDPRALAAALRTAVLRVDPAALSYRVTALEERLDAQVAPRRFQATLLATFSAAALLLAALGLHGLIQFAVATRTREIAVRMALGARPAHILQVVAREAFVLCLAGLGLGIAAALALGPALANLLYGVGPRDPGTLLAVALLVVGVAGAACFFPARRAMRLAPVAALRQGATQVLP